MRIAKSFPGKRIEKKLSAYAANALQSARQSRRVPGRRHEKRLKNLINLLSPAPALDSEDNFACDGSDFHKLAGKGAGGRAGQASSCPLTRMYAGRLRTEGECRFDSKLSGAFAFRAMALAWFEYARSSVYARIGFGLAERGAFGGAGALVQLAASCGRIALFIGRRPHRAV